MARFRFAEDIRVLPGLVAVALFVVMAAAFLGANLPDPAGFPADATLIADIGYSLFDFTEESGVPTEGFLAAFELIDLVLVAALVGAILLAKREDGSIGNPLNWGDDE
ncbi:NADH-quinone oxidoreductase subunit J [Salarchaeum japonicum]|uniref:NADH-quinone oxidoreductase subunit J family protein n=1 Tax=Salarchaeum japonicum TaxID=555573 RepID=UPI003C73B391